MNFEAFLNSDSLWNVLFRFGINLAIILVLTVGIYYRFSRKAEYLFSYILIGVMIFLICSILRTVDLELGMALGLFALFAIIRFRTEPYTVKEITYFFVIIGISVINSQANIPPPIIGAAIINLSVILITYILEFFLQKNMRDKLLITYNKVELLKPGLYNELLNDLSHLTGQTIEKAKINKINVERNNADLEVYFKDARIEKLNVE